MSIHKTEWRINRIFFTQPPYITIIKYRSENERTPRMDGRRWEPEYSLIIADLRSTLIHRLSSRKKS